MIGASTRPRSVGATVMRNLLAGGFDGPIMPVNPKHKAIDIPTVPTQYAATPLDCERLARRMNFPLALKIISPDIIHKSDVGGVMLDLRTPQEVKNAAESMLRRIRHSQPAANLTGFSVQEMAWRPGALELIVGATIDPIFGPVILFGQGGTAVEVIGDRAVALPPLTPSLAGDLVARTRVSKLLAGYRNRPAADLPAIVDTLLKVSQLILDLPAIGELDINPLLADEAGVLALDGRVRLQNRRDQRMPLAD